MGNERKLDAHFFLRKMRKVSTDREIQIASKDTPGRVSLVLTQASRHAFWPRPTHLHASRARALSPRCGFASSLLAPRRRRLALQRPPLSLARVVSIRRRAWYASESRKTSEQSPPATWSSKKKHLSVSFGIFSNSLLGQILHRERGALRPLCRRVPPP